MPVLCWTIAQAPPPPPAGTLVDDIFWITLAFIFLSAIVGAVLARRRKDVVLKMVHDYHVTVQMTNGSTVWGDLFVDAQGMEVRYDAPFRTAGGSIKSSSMIYDKEQPGVLAICRWDGDQSEEERRERAEQVRRRSNPGPMRKFARWVRNWFNTIRDAFGQAMSAFIGRVGKAKPGGVVATQQGHVEKIGQTLLGPGHAYEPMLERHIGLPVVLEIVNPMDPRKRPVEFAGYLAEYSKDYVAVFNIEHNPTQTIELRADQPAERDGLRVEPHPHETVVTNLHDVPLIVSGVASDSGEERRLGVALLSGGVAKLPSTPGARRIRLLRVPRLDLVCPRLHATVRHASLDVMPEIPATNLPPAQEEARVVFP